MITAVNQTQEQLNYINVRPSTQTGARGVLEATEGIGSKINNTMPTQANRVDSNPSTWFTRFTDEYNGTNPTFHMTIEKTTWRCLLDTGASVNLIGHKTLNEILPNAKRKMTPTTTKAQDVQGNKVPLSGAITLPVQFGNTNHNLHFEVVSNSDTLILGNPYIYKEDLIIVGREGFGSRQAIPPPGKRPRDTTHKIYAAQDITVQAGTSTKIRAKVKGPRRQWAPDINRTFLAGDQHIGGLEMYPTLSPLTTKGELTVLVTSIEAPFDFTIEEGTPLGEATSNFEDGEKVVSKVMADLADIQKQVNYIPAENIVNGLNPMNDVTMEVEPPGFEITGPKNPYAGPAEYNQKQQKFDTQRENQGATPETAHIIMDNATEKEKIKALLKKHKKIFSRSNYDIGHFCIDGEVQKVKLTISDTTPIVEKYRSLSPAKREAAEQILRELEKHGIITRKASGWASQAVWVAKSLPELSPERAKELNIPFIPGTKDPTAPRNLRFTTDFRTLNDRLESVQWPLPSVKHVLGRLRNTKYVTVLDASHSFYCIELDDQSKLYTGFQTCEKNFVMERLAMGLRCSSGILNACLAKTLAKCEKFTIPYSDNILIISPDAKSHTKHIAQTLQALEDHGWKFKLNKCHWGVSDTIKIFGMQISLKNGTIAPDPDKVKDLMQTPKPKTRKQMKSFLGGAAYFTECLPNVGQSLAILHDLTKPTNTGHKDTITWTREADQAFHKVLEVLSGDNRISMPRWDQPMHLVCDAGPQHVASMLCQLDENDKWTPLGFFTKKLSSTECKLSQIERECLAIIYGVRQTANYISHTKVYIHSDSQPFVLLKKYHSQNQKLARWKMFLESFDHALVWQSSNTPAISFVDFLSRPPITKLLNRKITKQDIESLPKDTPAGVYEHQEYEKLLEEIISKDPTTNATPESIKTITEAAAAATPQTPTRKHQELRQRIAAITRSHHRQLGTPNRPTATGNKTASPEAALVEIIIAECPFLNLEQLRALQQNCSILGPVYKNIDRYPDYTIHEGILLKKFHHKEIHRILLAVPVTLADDLIADIHRGSATAHSGKKKLSQMIRSRYFVPQLRRRIDKTVDNCAICGFYKPRKTSGIRPTQKSITPRGPGDIWAFDHIQIVSNPDDQDRTSLLCFVDLYSHFVVTQVVEKTLTAEQVADAFLTEIVSRFGVPRAVLSDNGADMDSTLFRETANLLNMTKLTIAPGSPRSNGVCERVQGLILSAIKHQAAQHRVKPKHFGDLAVWATLAINAQPFQDIEPPLSPAEIFLGRSIAESSFFGFANATYSYRNLEDFNRRMIAAQSTISEIIGSKNRYLSELRSKKKILDSPVWSMPPGCLVALRDKTQARQSANVKLRPRYRGVYIVVKETPTSCLIRPFSSESILEDMETEEEAPRGRGRCLPRYKIVKADKNDLKKLKHLVFYSQPMAKKFLEHLVAPAPTPGQEYDVIEDMDIQPTKEPEPEDDIPTPGHKRPPQEIPEGPKAKISRVTHTFPFEEN